MRFLMIKFMKFHIHVILGICVSDGFVVVTPRNKAVVAGQRMEMICRTDNNSFVRHWTFRSFTNPPKTMKFEVDSKTQSKEDRETQFGIEVDSNGSVVFYTNETNVQDAGIYTCRAETSGAKESIYSAALVVFHRKVACEASTSDGYVVVKCNVQLRGDWSPTVEWEQHGTNASDVHLVTNVNITSNNSDKTITSSMFIDLGSIKCGSYFTFKTYFELHNTSLRVNATNIPDFNYTWNSSTLDETCQSILESTSITSTSTGKSIYTLFAIVSVTFFMLAVAISISGCIIVKTKTAEWLSNLFVVPNRIDGRSARGTLRTMERTQENNDSHVNLQPEGGALQSDLTVPTYSTVCKDIKEGRPTCMDSDIYQDETEIADAEMTYSTYSLAEDGLLFDNIRPTRLQNNETPEQDSVGLYAEAEFFD